MLHKPPFRKHFASGLYKSIRTNPRMSLLLQLKRIKDCKRHMKHLVTKRPEALMISCNKRRRRTKSQRERQKKMKHRNVMYDPMAMLQDPIIKKRIHEHNVKTGSQKPFCKYMDPPRYHPRSKTLFKVHWNCTPDHFIT
jgi:hypothetical protein